MLKKLTDENVAAATGDRKRQQVFLWDRDTAGLGLRITSRGLKSWVYRFSVEGRERRITLGAYPTELDLTAARQLVANHSQKVALRQDPSEIVSESPRERTLGDLWSKFKADYVPRRSVGHQRNLSDAFERFVLPRLGAGTTLGALTWEDVDRWHQLLGQATPTQANRALAALRKALNTAKQWGWLERGAPNPATDHEMHPERKAGRPFSSTELGAIGAALKQEGDPVIRAALTVYLLSGLRPSEVCSLRWSDLHPGGLLFLEKTKTGERSAVLPLRAEKLLGALPRVSNYIFPGRMLGQHLGGEEDSHGLGNAWKRIRTQAGLAAGRRLYDARHTWVTTAASLGIGDDVRRVLAGHTPASGSAHGAYLHADPKFRRAADQVANSLAKSLGL
jgi:integrase